MSTINDYLEKISLDSKDVAVVGPNMYVREDPSPLYFANKMLNINGTLSILDDKPTWTMACHGNINEYMENFKDYLDIGIHAKTPNVIIGDVTKTTIKNAFDIIYEVNTTKCILNAKARELKEYTKPATQIINAYHQMLKENGCAILVYPDEALYAGMSCFIELAQKDSRLETTLEKDFFTLKYQLSNIDKEKYTRAKKNKYNNKIISDIDLPAIDSESIYLGDGYNRMKIMMLRKIKG